MCGIYGAVSFEKPLNFMQLTSMARLTRHRGPDASAFFLFDRHNNECSYDIDIKDFTKVSLREKSPGFDKKECKQIIGHNRLSIIGLGEKGTQPMNYLDRYVLVFNGEIYNYLKLKNELEKDGYLFFTDTDTEIILAAYDKWGKDCFNKFKGMFAFSIFDKEEKELTLVRDRFGIKPLYYYSDDEAFYYCSEIKGFTDIPSWSPKANISTSLDFIVWNILDHTSETMFQDVNQLLPGHFISLKLNHGLEISKDKCHQECWYDIKENLIENDGQNYSKYFHDSIEDHLIADVQVGSCLSGGLDSSSIVSSIPKTNTNNYQFKTVTAQSEVQDLDETQLAKEVIDKHRVSGSFVMPSLDGLKEKIDHILWHQEEPFISTSNLLQFEVFSRAKALGIKVMLDGQGADESLAGYKGFIGSCGASLIKRLQLLEFSKFTYSFKNDPVVSYSYVVFSSIGKLFPSVHSFLKSLSGEVDVTKFIQDSYKKDINKNPSLKNLHRDPLIGDIYNQLSSTSLPMLLHWEDRASMASSIEARVPFLDHELVEYSLGIPNKMRFKDGYSKFVLRDMQEGFVPENILNNRRKLGYVTAEEYWMKSVDTEYFRSLLQEAIEDLEPLLNDSIIDHFDFFIKGKVKFSYIFWRVICYSLWIKKFKVSIKGK